MKNLKTVLITGASEGIGRCFAEEFARKKHDLILVARNQEKLTQLADDLSMRFHINTLVLATDLTVDEAPGHLADRVDEAGWQVDILLNNAGMMQTEKLAEADSPTLNNLLQLNIVSLVNLTQIFVQSMIARGKGKIINVGSIASFMPTPNFSAYGASKAFVLSFSEGLSEELRGTGVSVTCVCPGMTATNMLHQAGSFENYLPGFLKADPHKLARQAYEAASKDEVVFLDKIANKMLVQWARHYPKWIVRGVNGLVGRWGL